MYLFNYIIIERKYFWVFCWAFPRMIAAIHIHVHTNCTVFFYTLSNSGHGTYLVVCASTQDLTLSFEAETIKMC